ERMDASRLGLMVGLTGAALLGACAAGPSATIRPTGYDYQRTAVAETAAPAAQAPTVTAAADLQAKGLFEGACGSCHGLDVVTGQRKTPAGWSSTVSRMVDKGAALDQDQVTEVSDYLARHYGTG